LSIFSACTNLIRTLPLLTFDEHNCEDVSAYCEDHAAEALRYGLMSRPRPMRQTPILPAPRYDPLAGPAPTPSGYRGL